MKPGTLKVKSKRTDICILRMLMCFCVVLCHFGGESNESFPILNGLYTVRLGAVLVFMFISFYLSAKLFLNRATEKWGKRLQRLLIPQIGWAFVYFLVYYAILKIGIYNIDVHPSDLLWQLTTGHSEALNDTMWYQTDLIILTLLFFAIAYACRNKATISVILNLLMIAAVVMQYTGANTHLFFSLRYELKYPLGRLCEMMPLAVLGMDFYLIHNRIDQRLRNRLALFAAVALVYGLAFRFQSVLECTGFSYQGLYFLALTVFIFELFSIIPFDRLSYGIKSQIERISRFTLGIYCIHRLVASLIGGCLIKLGVIKDIGEKNCFLFCVLLYAVCYVVCYCIYLIPNKYCKQMVE